MRDEHWHQKVLGEKALWPAIAWSVDEEVAYRLVTNEVHFFDGAAMNRMMLLIFFTIPSTSAVVMKTFTCVTFYDDEGGSESKAILTKFVFLAERLLCIGELLPKLLPGLAPLSLDFADFDRRNV